MDFALTDEQSTIFDMAYAFGQERIAPLARQWEADGEIPKSLWPELAAFWCANKTTARAYRALTQP